MPMAVVHIIVLYVTLRSGQPTIFFDQFWKEVFITLEYVVALGCPTLIRSSRYAADTTQSKY